MKIALISPSFYPATFYGGPIYCTYDLAKEIKKLNVDIRVITTNANGKARLKEITGIFHKLENGLPVKYFKSLDMRGTSPTMVFNLASEIKKTDIVHLVSVFSPPTPFTLFLSKYYKRNVILFANGQLGKWCLEQGNKFKKLWLKYIIKPYLDIIYWHSTSFEEEKAILDVYPSAKTFVSPNGVSEDLFSLTDKIKDKMFYNKYTGFNCSDKKIIISMGRLQEVKGFDILIEAIGMISKTEPVRMIEGNGFTEEKNQDWMIDKIGKQDVVLLIAGEDFGEKKKLDWMIDNLGLREKVFLVGMIEGKDKVEFLRNADVFALASHHENFGIVYAEALAAGTPVIASKNTPWQDVEKYDCGKWIENTPDKFAEAINTILNSDLVEMGKKSRQYVEENFRWERISNNFISKIQTLIT